MSYPESATELLFEPPGPGSWAQDPVHFPRPVTRYWAEMHPEPFARGTHEFARYYGLLLAGLNIAYVNGFAYNSTPPIADEEIPGTVGARAGGVRAQTVARPAPRLG